MDSFKEKYDAYLASFNTRLEKFLEETKCEPEILDESFKYSLKCGGKRVRPVLMLAVADLLGVSFDAVIDYALAIELIHTYSLIHDDLPEMDNDDFRRGKPSNHKVFGAGNAVLAGDALLNSAYYILLCRCLEEERNTEAALFMCDCAGINGMIAGQSADLYCSDKKITDAAWLDFIVENKTSRLMSASAAVPSVLSGGKYFPELKQFGGDLGKLFQIVDDILDVSGKFESTGKSIGKDELEGKLTYVSFYGADESRVYADIMADKCIRILEGIEGDTSFLREFVSFVRSRDG